MEVPIFLIETHLIIQTLTQNGLYVVFAHAPDCCENIALLHAALPRSQRINHLLFSGQTRSFSIESKNQKGFNST